MGGKKSLDGLREHPSNARPTLASQGIDKNLAHQARTLGALSEENFERAVSDARTAVGQAVKTVVRGATGTGENEWYSESVYLAGPGVFRRDAGDYGAALKRRCHELGLEPLWPLDNVPKGTTPIEIARQIRDMN